MLRRLRSPFVLAALLAASACTSLDTSDGEGGISNHRPKTAAASLPQAKEVWINVDGIPARGLVAYPKGGKPTRLVVCAHGMGHTVESWRAHLERIAGQGAIAVAMDYAPYFDLDRGAAETVAAARYFQQRYPSIDTSYLFSVSMGSAVGGMALAESRGVFDHWIDMEGLANVFEAWTEATAIGHRAAKDMEADTGGTPATASEAYVRRSATLRTAEIAAHGLKGVVMAHSLNDGLVPYDQAREMADGLAAAGVPWEFYNVVRGPCAEEGTTLTGDFGLFNPACLSGHATESSSTHPIMTIGFDVLFESFANEHVYDGHREYVVDQPD